MDLSFSFIVFLPFRDCRLPARRLRADTQVLPTTCSPVGTPGVGTFPPIVAHRPRRKFRLDQVGNRVAHRDQRSPVLRGAGYVDDLKLAVGEVAVAERLLRLQVATLMGPRQGWCELETRMVGPPDFSGATAKALEPAYSASSPIGNGRASAVLPGAFAFSSMIRGASSIASVGVLPSSDGPYSGGSGSPATSGPM